MPTISGAKGDVGMHLGNVRIQGALSSESTQLGEDEGKPLPRGLEMRARLSWDPRP